jgi:hypothetical protein
MGRNGVGSRQLAAFRLRKADYGAQNPEGKRSKTVSARLDSLLLTPISLPGPL